MTPLDGSGAPDASKEPVTVPIEADGTFSFRLPAGTYTFSAEGLNADGKCVLYGEYKNTVTVPDDVFTPISITVTTISSGDGAGEVSLPLAFDADCNIKCVTATWEAGGTSKKRSFTAASDGVLTELTFTMQPDGETAPPSVGYYTVTFSFYSDTAAQQELYWCTEQVSVSENLTTDTWLNDSGQPYFDEADGKTSFHLTHADIAKSTLYYVRSIGSTKNEGTYFEPFDSIEKALQKIARTYDSGSKYKISLLSDITESADTPSYAEDTIPNSAFISIENPGSASDAAPFSLTISSNGGAVYTINAKRDSTHTGRVMYIGENAHVTLRNVKITGGNIDDNGGGIFIYNGKLTLSGVAITDCSAASTDASSIKGNGGGIYNTGTLTADGGTVSGCKAMETAVWQGGGGIYSSGTFTLSDVTITGCVAEAYGGGILTAGTSTENTITDCTITSCTTQGLIGGNNAGGGIFVNSGKLIVDGGTISECVTKSNGGGVFVRSGASAEIKNCGISGCKASQNGGGINNQGTLTVTGGTVSDCNGMGAIFNFGKLTVTGGAEISGCSNACGISNSSGTLSVDGCTISDCAYSESGGIYIYSSTTSATIKNCTITNCRTESTASSWGFGGGIKNRCNSTMIENCTVTNCSASKSGGGIYNDVTDATNAVTITDCEITGCTAEGTAAGQGGGGIYNEAGALELSGVTITGGNDTSNPDAKYGGGIYNNTDATVTITDNGVNKTTISKCTASSGGGGICNAINAILTADRINISECKAVLGSGGIRNLGNLTVSGGQIATCTGTAGGGITNGVGGTITISNVDFATCTGTIGGGIYTVASGSVIDCQFRGCVASQNGGGICKNGGTLTVSGATYEGCTPNNTYGL